MVLDFGISVLATAILLIISETRITRLNHVLSVAYACLTYACLNGISFQWHALVYILATAFGALVCNGLFHLLGQEKNGVAIGVSGLRSRLPRL